jgi:hypothetical protein
MQPIQPQMNGIVLIFEVMFSLLNIHYYFKYLDFKHKYHVLKKCSFICVITTLVSSIWCLVDYLSHIVMGEAMEKAKDHAVLDCLKALNLKILRCFSLINLVLKDGFHFSKYKCTRL